jgi:hypothetical protein
MSQHISRIKVLFYRLAKPINPWPTDLAALQNQSRNDLEQWASEVPSVLLFAPAELKHRLTMKLKLHYHGAMCLLHQSSQAFVQPSDQALKICYDNAAERLRLYETLYEAGDMVYSWRTVHDIFLAGATVMYCVWICTSVRETVSMPTLAGLCRQCSSLLSVAGEWWPTIRKSKSSLERLASHTIEMVAEKSRSSDYTSHRVSATSPFHNPNTGLAEAAEPPLNILPENIEEALASVLNHDHGGQLSNIFDGSRDSPFSLDVSNMNGGFNEFDDGFWSFMMGSGKN